MPDQPSRKNDLAPNQQSGKTNPAEAEVHDPSGWVAARLDLERTARCGTPEAIFALAKTTAETLAIAEKLVEKQGHALITRMSPDTLAALRKRWPDLLAGERSGTAVVGVVPRLEENLGPVVITLAGTSDIPVAEEAALTLRSVGIPCEMVADVGVAGIHRLLARLEELRRAKVVLAVAGMEGALPSVVAGLISAPVVAVPTSVGYGASLGGISALLGMLNSCTPGITVVNIDNGFGAAVAAARMLRIPR